MRVGAEVLGVHEVHLRGVGISLGDDELDEFEAAQAGVDHDLLALVGKLFEGRPVGDRGRALVRSQLLGLFALGCDFAEAAPAPAETAPATTPAAAAGQELARGECSVGVAV